MEHTDPRKEQEQELQRPKQEHQAGGTSSSGTEYSDKL